MTPRLIHLPSSDRVFERLYRRHVHDVYRYTLAVLHHEADAEDVTQATFLNAYRFFKRGERPIKPHNWLIKIAHNECRQRFRASARRPREVALQETDGQHAAGEADVPTAAEIRHALAQLSFNQRAALVMRELEGRSYAEIASLLETSVSAVETLLFRARRALREQLEGSLTCGEAELTLTRRLEGSLSKAERGPLRAHLRECKECATLERRQRVHRGALKASLGAVPLPASLQSFLGGGATAGGAAGAGSGLAGKVAAVVAAGAVATGAGHQAVQSIAAKPTTTKAEIALPQSLEAASTLTQGRAQRTVAPGGKQAQASAPATSVKLDPADKGAAHRRTLRPSERGVETVAPEADPPAAKPSTPAAVASPAPAKPQSPTPLLPPVPPPPPPPPQIVLPPVPPLPPLPPLPPPPQLPPPPPLPPLPPLPPVPPLPPLPPLPQLLPPPPPPPPGP
jgi:RNA polymerase sigma factor (sigma-70 family)